MRWVEDLEQSYMEKLAKASGGVDEEQKTEEKVARKKAEAQGADKAIVRRALNFEEVKEEGEVDEQEILSEKISAVNESIPGPGKSHQKLQRDSLPEDTKNCIIT